MATSRSCFPLSTRAKRGYAAHLAARFSPHPAIGAFASRRRTDRTIWTNDNTLSSQYATPVETGGYLYGIHGRKIGVAELRCIEAATGKVHGRKRASASLTSFSSGDKLFIQKADGQIRLAVADPAKYRELAAAELASTVDSCLRLSQTAACSCSWQRWR